MRIEPRERRKLIAARWRHVVGVAIAAAAIALVVFAAQPSVLAALCTPPLWLVVCAPLFTVALVIARAPRDLWAFLGVRYLVIYPPYWVGAVVGFAVALGLIALHPTLRAEYAARGREDGLLYGAYSPHSDLMARYDDQTYQTGPLRASVVGAGVVLIAALASLEQARRRRKEHSVILVGPNDWLSEAPTDQQLLGWLRDDKPIAEQRQDYFDARIIARRVAMRILGAHGDVKANSAPSAKGQVSKGALRPQSISVNSPSCSAASTTKVATPEELTEAGDASLATASNTKSSPSVTVPALSASQTVIGRLGSGKSSVRCLVATYLARSSCRDVKILNVELWPYATPQAAVEGILRTLVDVFSAEIGVGRLGAIPAAYGLAIAKAGGVADWVPQTLRTQRLPAEHLRTLDEVATIVGRRYVLWVEDLERFAAGDPSADAADGELERLAPIRALLHGLDNSTSFTVITATTDLFRRFDLEKISRYVERLPDVPFSEAYRLVAHVRAQLVKQKEYFDPATVAVRSKLGWDDSDDPGRQRRYGLLGDHISDMADAVAALANTPRTLKQGLRRAMETWNILAGEIDIDDVVAMSMVVASLPQVAALLDSRMALLQGRTIRMGKGRDEDPIASFENDLRACKIDDRAREAVLVIVKAIFGQQSTERPQSIRNAMHADYWTRFNALPEIPEAEADQTMLRTLRSRDVARILPLLADERTSRAVEDFAMVLDDAILPQLLVGLAERLSTASLTIGEVAWPDRHAPGMVPLWRMFRRRIGFLDLNTLASALERCVEIAAPRSLFILHELVYWYTTDGEKIDDLLPYEMRTRIKAQVQSRLLVEYVGRPEGLALALSGAPHHVLLWLCWTIERVRAREHRRGLPFEAWPALAETLIAALELNAQVVAIQIAPFVAFSTERFRGADEYYFDARQCELLFGDAEAFVRKMRELTAGATLEPIVQAIVEERTPPTVAGHEHAGDSGDDLSRDNENGLAPPELEDDEQADHE